MPVWLSIAWKVALAVALLAGIVVSARARAPRRALPSSDLHRLVLCALFLYAVGALAWLNHQLRLAILIYAAGIATAALAAWLSRGHEWPEPPDEESPHGEGPPPDPDGVRFDWEAFERDLRRYTARTRVSG